MLHLYFSNINYSVGSEFHRTQSTGRFGEYLAG